MVFVQKLGRVVINQLIRCNQIKSSSLRHQNDVVNIATRNLSSKNNEKDGYSSDSSGSSSDEDSTSLQTKTSVKNIESSKKQLDQLLSVVKISKFGTKEDLNDKLAKPVKKKHDPVDIETLKKPSDIDEKSISYRLLNTANKIGEKIGGHEGEAAKKTLINMVKIQNQEAKPPSKKSLEALRSLIKEMKIEKLPKGKPYDAVQSEETNEFAAHSRQVRPRPPPFRPRQQTHEHRPPPQQYQAGNQRPTADAWIDELPMGIFRPIKSPFQSTLNTWSRLAREEIESICLHQPRNGFEEMILLTKEGKLWPFPINNELGLEAENSVPFYEHVFLDKHLHGFPEKGPVREFMDIILIGISNNPYITVERKIAYIDWYRDYFKTKEDVLRSVNAI